jgi:DNA-binding response OmpR family regulator
MGLGLCLCKKLIQMMGGGITVESIYEKGTTITIDIPFIEEQYEITDASIKVLIVDDIDNNRIQLRTYLHQWKIITDTVSTFKEAKKLLEYNKYDIFMLNVASNMGDAFVFLRFIESNFSSSRIISINFPNENNLFDGYIQNISDKLEVYNTILAVRQKRRDKCTSLTNSSIRICIVEDDELSSFALREILSACGYTNVTSIDSGEQAVREITHSAYDNVFMDCKLKEMNGIKATKLIKETGSSAWIIGVTASITDDEKVEWLNSGLDGYLTKPFTKETIEKIIGQYK